MNLSKREYVALELLKELVKIDTHNAVNVAYSMADKFIAESNKCNDDAMNYGFKSESTLDLLFELNVKVLEFSDRTLEILKSRKIITIAQLVGFGRHVSYDYLWKNERTSLVEIDRKLESIGLNYKMSKAEMYDYNSSEYVKITKDNDGELMLRPITS